MAGKKILQDMVSSKRSIQRVPLSRALSEPPLHPKMKAPAVRPSKGDVPPKISHPRKPKSVKQGGLKRKMWVPITFAVLILCFVIMAAAASLLFSKGTIYIKPKVTNVSVNASLVAKADAVAPDLGYQVLTITEDAHAPIVAKQGKAIERKATAKVVLYNSYSKTPQTILAGTRLMNSKGLVYKTLSKVIVPGQYAVKGQKTLVPGSIVVTITADQPGAEYNTALTDLSGDFNFVAYKGGPKYTTIYARLKTDLIGGYKGYEVVVDPAILTSTQDSLKKNLLSQIVAKAKNLTPTGYTLFDDAYQVSFEPIQPVFATSTADIGMKGTYSGYMMKTDTLVKAFAREQLSQFPSNLYTFGAVDNLDFNFAKGATTTALKSKQLPFTLKGAIKIIGVVPVEQLKKELAGVRVSDSAAIIQRYSTITSAYAKIFPVWMRSLPDSIDRIVIEVQSE